ncbi:MAG: ECF-type sigma factor [Planctomycetota bacterium]|nr:sigma-70 family RNA polymerase sigma factor [Planctomycetota bacterium]MCB9825990.1 sigma-70 family RNA polymerase sigma factor [Planctomycetota bacterium]MCB9901613.1 sigma-70 family RNA polymerase sigma factor [Planctomycetota bacterium]
MPDPSPDLRSRTTRLLVGLDGSADPSLSIEVLVPDLEAELKRLASALLRRERSDHTLQATALVNELFLRLADPTAVSWSSRAHFMALAARLMRRILVDHARAKQALKRGGDRTRVPLHEAVAALRAPDLDLLDLEELMERLGAIDARMREVVEMRFFGGMALDEIAEVLGVSRTTVEDTWYGARAWLRAHLEYAADR